MKRGIYWCRLSAGMMVSLFLFLGPAPGFCDRVHLKNGKNIEGIIEREEGNSITLDIGMGRVVLKKEDIFSLQRYAPEEQDELIKEWQYKYFRYAEFTPRGLEDIGKRFRELEDKREIAGEAKREKDAAVEKLEQLKSELEELNPDLVRVSEKLSTLKPEDNLKEYNSLVEAFNSLMAKIRLRESHQDALNKQAVNLDKKISDYINDLTVFRKEVIFRGQGLEKPPQPELNYYWESIKKEIGRMEVDFVKHNLDYRPYGSAIMVSVLLNGLVKANLLVDTGASLVVISQETADKLGLRDGKAESSFLVTMADGRKVKARPIYLDTIQAGEAEVKDVRAAVLENSEGSAEDGLLGMSFLENFLVKIDGRSNKLILEEFNPR